jgi:hypothetical protein
VAKLDELLGEQKFSQRYCEFAKMRQFPDWEKLYAELGIRMDAEHLVFVAGAVHAAAREQITAPRKDTSDAPAYQACTSGLAHRACGDKTKPHQCGNAACPLRNRLVLAHRCRETSDLGDLLVVRVFKLAEKGSDAANDENQTDHEHCSTHGPSPVVAQRPAATCRR